MLPNAALFARHAKSGKLEILANLSHFCLGQVWQIGPLCKLEPLQCGQLWPIGEKLAKSDILLIQLCHFAKLGNFLQILAVVAKVGPLGPSKVFDNLGNFVKLSLTSASFDRVWQCVHLSMFGLA